MKIFTSAQIHELDNYTIEHEPVKSIDLMERAAKVLTRAITHRWPQTVPVITFAGPGNNGGDALAVSRMLTEQGYQVHTFLFNINGHLSADCAENKRRLLDNKKSKNLVRRSDAGVRPATVGKGNTRYRRSVWFRAEQAAKRRLCLFGEIYQRLSS